MAIDRRDFLMLIGGGAAAVTILPVTRKWWFPCFWAPAAKRGGQVYGNFPGIGDRIGRWEERDGAARIVPGSWKPLQGVERGWSGETPMTYVAPIEFDPSLDSGNILPPNVEPAAAYIQWCEEEAARWKPFHDEMTAIRHDGAYRRG